MTSFDAKRRKLLQLTAATGGALTVSQFLSGAASEAVAQVGDAAPAPLDVVLSVNGRERRLTLDPRTTLLDALRENLHLTGAKKGCDQGQCGACTVIVGGRRIASCLTLATMHEGDSIITIEGLGTPERMHPMQAAFVKHDGYQCGYCTPGQICAAVAMLDEIRNGLPSHATRDLLGPVAASEDEVRERMSSNICRCAAYPNIVAAIREVAGEPT